MGTDLDLNSIATTVINIQKEVADIHLNPHKYGINSKVLLKDRGKDYTTAVDRIVEERQRQLLSSAFPQIGFLGEESGFQNENSRFFWIVDPTDGTAVYTLGGEYYSNSVALADRQEKKVLLGSVYQPATQREFLRVGGELTVSEHFLRKDGVEDIMLKRPTPSQTKGLPGLMGCSYGTSKHYDKIPGIKERLARVFEKTPFPGLKREYGITDARPGSGSSALFLCDIAGGNRHFALLYFQKAWDLAVGALFARDAGCIVECGDSLETISGGNIEEKIATCTKDTLINLAIFELCCMTPKI